MGTCEFQGEPMNQGYFWDPSCRQGMLGCNADGRHVECRFCGSGVYSSISCPVGICRFPNNPMVPYFWDPMCYLGMLGCKADGIHLQCRFCGDSVYSGIQCPSTGSCSFEQSPGTPYFWDSRCRQGMLGCLADGIHEQCRFCGQGQYAQIPCPAYQLCTFATEPSAPYFWDPECFVGKLGCNADGIHAQCRFCGVPPYQDVRCPGQAAGASSPQAGSAYSAFAPISKPQVTSLASSSVSELKSCLSSHIIDVARALVKHRLVKAQA